MDGRHGAARNGFWLGNGFEKISEAVRVHYDPLELHRPWTLQSTESNRVRLSFVPEYTRKLGGRLGPLGARLHWALGSFHGELQRANGDRVLIDGLRGHLEDVDARW